MKLDVLSRSAMGGARSHGVGEGERRSHEDLHLKVLWDAGARKKEIVAGVFRRMEGGEEDMDIDITIDLIKELAAAWSSGTFPDERGQPDDRATSHQLYPIDKRSYGDVGHVPMAGTVAMDLDERPHIAAAAVQAPAPVDWDHEMADNAPARLPMADSAPTQPPMADIVDNATPLQPMVVDEAAQAADGLLPPCRPCAHVDREIARFTTVGDFSWFWRSHPVTAPALLWCADCIADGFATWLPTATEDFGNAVYAKILQYLDAHGWAIVPQAGIGRHLITGPVRIADLRHVWKVVWCDGQALELINALRRRTLPRGGRRDDRTKLESVREGICKAFNHRGLGYSGNGRLVVMTNTEDKRPRFTPDLVSYLFQRFYLTPEMEKPNRLWTEAILASRAIRWNGYALEDPRRRYRGGDDVAPHLMQLWQSPATGGAGAVGLTSVCLWDDSLRRTLGNALQCGANVSLRLRCSSDVSFTVTIGVDGLPAEPEEILGWTKCRAGTETSIQLQAPPLPGSCSTTVVFAVFLRNTAEEAIRPLYLSSRLTLRRPEAMALVVAPHYAGQELVYHIAASADARMMAATFYHSMGAHVSVLTGPSATAKSITQWLARTTRWVAARAGRVLTIYFTGQSMASTDGVSLRAAGGKEEEGVTFSYIQGLAARAAGAGSRLELISDVTFPRSSSTDSATADKKCACLPWYWKAVAPDAVLPRDDALLLPGGVHFAAGESFAVCDDGGQGRAGSAMTIAIHDIISSVDQLQVGAAARLPWSVVLAGARELLDSRLLPAPTLHCDVTADTPLLNALRAPPYRRLAYNDLSWA